MKENKYITIGLTVFATVVAAVLILLTGKVAPILVLGAIAAVAVGLFVIEKPIVGTVLIAFLLPFERVGSFDIAGTTVRGSQIIGLLMIVSWLLYALTKNKKINTKNPLIILIALFFSASAISILNAVNVERAVTVILFELFVAIIAIVVPNVITTKEHFNRIVIAILFSAGVVSIFGLYQFLGDLAGLPPEITGLREQYTKQVFGFPRVQSTALEPLYFGNYLLIPIALLVALIANNNLFKRGNGILRKMHVLIPLLLLAGVNLLLTVSRGAYLALGVLGVMLFFAFIKFFIKPSRLIIFATIGGVACAILLAFIGLGQGDTVSTYIEHTTNTSSGAGVEERFATYSNAITLTKEHPIIGAGVGNFGPRIAQNPQITPEKGWLIVNNIYLEILAERGVLGLLTFLLLFGTVIVRSIKATRYTESKTVKTYLIALTLALVAILVQYATFSILYIFHIWFLIGLIIALQNLAFARKIKKA